MTNEKSLTEILAMSGYGAYVWPAFGVVVVTLLLLYVSARLRLKKALKTQQKLSAEQQP